MKQWSLGIVMINQSISCGHGLLKALQTLKTSSTMFKFINSVVWYSMPPGDRLPVIDTINGTEYWHLLSSLYIFCVKFDKLVKLVTLDGFWKKLGLAHHPSVPTPPWLGSWPYTISPFSTYSLIEISKFANNMKKLFLVFFFRRPDPDKIHTVCDTIVKLTAVIFISKYIWQV